MSPSAGIVLAGESRSFYAAVTDANGHNITDLTLILWSVPSSCGSVSPGVGPVATFTAAASAGGAYCMINATGTYISWSDADTAYVTVLYNGPVTVTVTPPNATLLRGGSQTFDAVTTDVGGHDVGAYTIVSWAATPVACGSFDPITNWRTTFTANLSAGGQTCTLTATGRFLGGSQQWTGSGSASVVVLPPDFDLSISPTSQAVTAGYQSQYTIAIAARNGFDSLVDLSIAGLPSGATADFMPSGPVTPGGVRLTISTTASTPPGTYTLALQGTSGTLVHLTNATLVVEALRDFSLAVAPSSRSVLPGESATFTITLTAINGFDTWATLTATGLPAGATASFSPATMTATQPSTLVILTSPSVVPGSYRVTVTGASGGVLYGAVHNQTVTLQVAESPSAIPAMIWWIVPAVAFAAILVAFVLVRTRRKKSKTADAGGDAGP